MRQNFNAYCGRVQSESVVFKVVKPRSAHVGRLHVRAYRMLNSGPERAGIATGPGDRKRISDFVTYNLKLFDCLDS